MINHGLQYARRLAASLVFHPLGGTRHSRQNDHLYHPLDRAGKTTTGPAGADQRRSVRYS
jgi:hypothetical protein